MHIIVLVLVLVVVIEVCLARHVCDPNLYVDYQDKKAKY